MQFNLYREAQRVARGSVVLLLLFLLLLFCSRAHAGTVTGTIAKPSGSGIANGTITLTLSQPSYLSGSYAATTTPITCGTDPNGAIVGIPAPLVAPTSSTGSGSLSAGTYYIKIAYFNGTGTTTVSPVASVVVGAASSITVNAPTLQPSGATGYKVYAGTVLGSETLQATVTGWSNATLSSLSAGSALPVSNTTTCTFAFNDSLIPSYTTYRMAVVDGSGNNVPGFPQPYYFSGTTVDISTLLPAKNLKANFPMPVLSNPTGSAPQSISGPLTVTQLTVSGGTSFLGSLTLSGAFTASSGAFTSLTIGGGSALTTSTATGTGNLVKATSPTIATPSVTNPTITSGGSWTGGPSITQPTIVTGVTSGSGFKHQRFTTGLCTTLATAGNFCNATLTWSGGGFADANYTVNCFGVNPANGVSQVAIGSKTATTFSLFIQTNTAQASTYGEIDCIAFHD